MPLYKNFGGSLFIEEEKKENEIFMNNSDEEDEENVPLLSDYDKIS